MKNLDKCLIFRNLVVTTQLVTCMKTKPLIQLREMIAAALSSMTNLGKSFRTFIIETMELYLTSSGRMNFTQMARCGRSCESRFRDDVNLKYLYLGPKVRKRGHPKKLARKVFFSTDLTLSARDIFDIYRTRFQLEFVFRDAKQFTGLTHCQARNKEALAFAFNASLSSVNVARAYARQQGHNLSVGSTKTLLHNAAMVDRFIAMSAKHANLRLNNTDFKELLFYGVRAVA